MQSHKLFNLILIHIPISHHIYLHVKIRNTRLQNSRMPKITTNITSNLPILPNTPQSTIILRRKLEPTHPPLLNYLSKQNMHMRIQIQLLTIRIKHTNNPRHCSMLILEHLLHSIANRIHKHLKPAFDRLQTMLAVPQA